MELHGLGPLDEELLLRISGLAAEHEEAPGGRSASGSSGAVSVLEDLGKR